MIDAPVAFRFSAMTDLDLTPPSPSEAAGMDAEPPEPSGPAPQTDPAPTPRTVWMLLVIGTLATAVPIIVAGIALAGRHWLPTGDMAQAELRLRGFWAHPPLVGAAGRLGTLNEQERTLGRRPTGRSGLSTRSADARWRPWSSAWWSCTWSGWPH